MGLLSKIGGHRNTNRSIILNPRRNPPADNIEVAHKSGPCTWDNEGKILNFQGNGDCVITVIATKDGYKDYSQDFSVNPALDSIDVDGWGEYGSVVAQGQAVNAPTLTGLDPGDATKVYTSNTTHICTVNQDTGAVTGLQGGTCGINLTLSKSGYNNNSHDYSFEVTGTFSSLTWNAFPTTARVGVATGALSPPVSSPPADEYTIAEKSGDCSWDNSNSILSFTAVTECILTVTAVKNGYNNFSKDFNITPLGGISVTDKAYGEAVFIGELATPSLTGLDPTDADTAYVSADDNICTVDNSTGVVTGVDEGECRITLTLSKTGYQNKVVEYVIPVVLSLNDFKAKHLFKGLALGESTRPVFADVDGDNDLDLVVGFTDGTLKYYQKNDSNASTSFTQLIGSYNPFNGIDVGRYSSPAFIDINGDGKQDLVVGEYQGRLKFFLNESSETTTTFTEKTSNDNPFNGVSVGNYSTPVFAYINDDNKIDLVVGEYDGYVNYYLNESTEDTVTFTQKTGNNSPFNGIDVGGESAPAFADLNGDNKVDLVVGNGGGTLKFYLNESTESTISFTAKTAASENPFDGFNVGAKSIPTFIDMNGDGKKDLIVGENHGILNYFLNESANNTLVFTDKTESKNPFNDIDIGSSSIPEFADINGDGKQDLVVGKYDGTLDYFLNESTENAITFTKKTSSENPFNSFDVGSNSTPEFADINGDGKLDLVVGEQDGNLNYFLNESTENTISFTAKTAASDNPFNNFDAGDKSVPELFDISGDGKLDLIVGETYGAFKYYLNESVGSTISFTEKTNNENPLNGLDAGDYSNPVFIDVNGDGKMDLVSGQYYSPLRYYLNESSGNTITFTNKTGDDNPFSKINYVGTDFAPAFTDINGDGKVELLVGIGSGHFLYVINYFGSWVSFF